ncbi:MAG TPA: TRAP transporter substrate-binding protein DctP, partial [Microvirga sp.]|nr:TRAP transporter substrate-binding protein DctP [Microvirga sp.]
YHEVTKHLTLTNHMYTPQIVIVSKRTWDKLSAEEQKILQDAATETTGYQRKLAREEVTKVLDQLKKEGMTIHELPPGEITKLQEKAKPVVEKYKKDLGEEFVAELYAEVDKVRATK